MSKTRLVVDGKWVYLCPQWSPLARLSRSSPVLQLKQPTPTQRSWFRHPQYRYFYTGNHPTHPASISSPADDAHRGTSSTRNLHETSQPGGTPSPLELSQTATASATPADDIDIITDLESRLARDAEREDLPAVTQHLKLLIQKHKRKPSADYYKALVLANCHPFFGSAVSLRHIWEEILAEDIEIGSDGLHAFIKALACHPDHLLRTTILKYMRQRWISLSVNGWNDLVVGLLRENQLALASDKIQHMTSLGIVVHQWVYVTLVHCLIANAEYEAAMNTIDRLADQEHGIHIATWHYLLDSASRDYHHDIVARVWERMVEDGFLNPSSGTCQNVLVSALRANDSHLAPRVFAKLAGREDNTALEVCETLLETHFAANEIPQAFQLLHAMMKSGLRFPDAAMRPFVEYCQRIRTRTRRDGSKELYENPMSVLEGMIGQNPDMKSTIPIVLVNAMMEVYLSLDDPRATVSMFEQRSSFSTDRPNLQTYHLLFQAFSQLKDLENARKHYDKLRQTSPVIQMDDRVYGLLITMCLKLSDFQQAEELLLVAQDSGVEFSAEALQFWRRLASQQPERDEKYIQSFDARLAHTLEGKSIKEEIESLTRASDEANPFTVARNKATAEMTAQKLQQSRTAYARRRHTKRQLAK